MSYNQGHDGIWMMSQLQPRSWRHLDDVSLVKTSIPWPCDLQTNSCSIQELEGGRWSKRQTQYEPESENTWSWASWLGASDDSLFPGSLTPECEHWSWRAWYFFSRKHRRQKGGRKILIVRGCTRWLRTWKEAKVAGNLLHISNYRGANIIHIECWMQDASWLNAKRKILPFCSKNSVPTLYFDYIVVTWEKIPGSPCPHNFNTRILECGSLGTRLTMYGS